MAQINNISILGAGAFGTSLAIALSQASRVSLFSSFDDHVQAMRSYRINEFFKNYAIPTTIEIDNTKNLLHHKPDCVLWAFPVGPTVEILTSIKDRLNGLPVIICSKGLGENGRLLSDIFENMLPNSEIFSLAGPNFAHEIAEGKLSVVNLMHKSLDKAESMARQLHSPSLKLLAGDDPIGLQIFGATKNIIAIASGILSGLNSGQNTTNALLSFACAEMQKLALSSGAKPDTILCPCGIGDLCLTALNLSSRNFKFGLDLALNQCNPQELAQNSPAVCEGVYSARQVRYIAGRLAISMPICETVFKIIYEHQPASSILQIFD